MIVALKLSAAVGVMLIQGQGCDKDEEEGFQWLKESAKMGCVYGEGLLSRQYLAMKLYSKACEAAFRYICIIWVAGVGTYAYYGSLQSALM